jgi:hypothetical protein
MRDEQTVIIAADQMISPDAEKMSRTAGIKMKFFRNLCGRKEIKIRDIKNTVFR